jgi:hypothetical protein
MLAATESGSTIIERRATIDSLEKYERREAEAEQVTGNGGQRNMQHCHNLVPERLAARQLKAAIKEVVCFPFRSQGWVRLA